MLRQLLQIKHLPDRRPPTRQQPLVQIELWICMIAPNRSTLKAGGITCHSRELKIPEPSHHTLCCLYPDEIRRRSLRELALLFIVEPVVCCRKPASDEEDVPLSKAEFVIVNHSFNVIQSDRLGFKGGDGHGARLSPVGEVEQDASTGYAAMLSNDCVWLEGQRRVCLPGFQRYRCSATHREVQ